MIDTESSRYIVSTLKVHGRENGWIDVRPLIHIIYLAPEEAILSV